MRRRLWVLALVVVLAALVACSGGSKSQGGHGSPKAEPAVPSSSIPPATATPVTSPQRPNIVLLMTDDQTLSDMSVMPQTRRLIGAQGATFDRAFSSYPLCCPARTTVLTGLDAHNHHVMGNQAPWGGYSTYHREGNSLPVWLTRAGYRTIMLGKYLSGYPKAGHETYVPPGWNEWYVPVKGTYNYAHFRINENGRLRRHREYQSQYIADRASQIIEAQDPRHPFFLWANFLAPHVGAPHEPYDPPTSTYSMLGTPYVEPKYQKSLSDLQLPDPRSIDEKDMSDKAPFMQRRPILPRAYLREGYQQRLESLRSVDDAVAQIVGTLKSTGQLANTMLVFVSDNGFLVGQHRWYQKILGYENSIRVPLLIRGPGVKPDVHVDQQVSLADLSATIIRAAGATPGNRLDGVSLLPLVRHPGRLRDRAMLLEAGGWPYQDQSRLYNGVRTADNWVMLRWYDGSREVYNLNKDPLELHGEISPDERARVPGLTKALNRLSACKAHGCNDVTGR